MNFISEIARLWNDNFNKGVTVYQMFLMGWMVIGVMLNNQTIVLFSMFNCLAGYFEQTENRFCLGDKS